MADKTIRQGESYDLRYQVYDGVEPAAPISATCEFINDETGEVVIEQTSAGVDAEDAIISFTLTDGNGGTATPGFYRAVFVATFSGGETRTHIIHIQVIEREGKAES